MRFLVKAYRFLRSLSDCRKRFKDSSLEVVQHIVERQTDSIKAALEKILNFLLNIFRDGLNRPAVGTDGTHRALSSYFDNDQTNYYYILVTVWYIERYIPGLLDGMMTNMGGVPTKLRIAFVFPDEQADFRQDKDVKASLLRWYHYTSALRLFSKLEQTTGETDLETMSERWQAKAKIAVAAKISVKDPYSLDDEPIDRLAFLARELGFDDGKSSKSCEFLVRERIHDRQFSTSINPGVLDETDKGQLCAPWEIHALCHHSRLLLWREQILEQGKDINKARQIMGSLARQGVQKSVEAVTHTDTPESNPHMNTAEVIQRAGLLVRETDKFKPEDSSKAGDISKLGDASRSGGASKTGNAGTISQLKKANANTQQGNSVSKSLSGDPQNEIKRQQIDALAKIEVEKHQVQKYIKAARLRMDSSRQEIEVSRQRLSKFLTSEVSILSSWERVNPNARASWLQSEATGIIGATLLDICAWELNLTGYEIGEADDNATKEKQTEEARPHLRSATMSSRDMDTESLLSLSRTNSLELSKDGTGNGFHMEAFTRTVLKLVESEPLDWLVYQPRVRYHPESFFNSLNDTPDLYRLDNTKHLQVPKNLRIYLENPRDGKKLDRTPSWTKSSFPRYQPLDIPTDARTAPSPSPPKSAVNRNEPRTGKTANGGCNLSDISIVDFRQVTRTAKTDTYDIEVAGKLSLTQATQRNWRVSSTIKLEAHVISSDRHQYEFTTSANISEYNYLHVGSTASTSQASSAPEVAPELKLKATGYLSINSSAKGGFISLSGRITIDDQGKADVTATGQLVLTSTTTEEPTTFGSRLITSGNDEYELKTTQRLSPGSTSPEGVIELGQQTGTSTSVPKAVGHLSLGIMIAGYPTASLTATGSTKPGRITPKALAMPPDITLGYLLNNIRATCPTSCTENHMDIARLMYETYLDEGIPDTITKDSPLELKTHYEDLYDEVKIHLKSTKTTRTREMLHDEVVDALLESVSQVPSTLG